MRTHQLGREQSQGEERWVEDPPSKAHNGGERRRNIRREEEAPKKGLVKLYFPVVL